MTSLGHVKSFISLPTTHDFACQRVNADFDLEISTQSLVVRETGAFGSLASVDKVSNDVLCQCSLDRLLLGRQSGA